MRWFRVVLVLRPRDFAPLLKVLILLGVLIAAKAKSQTMSDENLVIELKETEYLKSLDALFIQRIDDVNKTDFEEDLTNDQI